MCVPCMPHWAARTLFRFVLASCFSTEFVPGIVPKDIEICGYKVVPKEQLSKTRPLGG